LVLIPLLRLDATVLLRATSAAELEQTCGVAVLEMLPAAEIVDESELTVAEPESIIKLMEIPGSVTAVDLFRLAWRTVGT
jgi:hypothetical protein